MLIQIEILNFNLPLVGVHRTHHVSPHLLHDIIHSAEALLEKWIVSEGVSEGHHYPNIHRWRLTYIHLRHSEAAHHPLSHSVEFVERAPHLAVWN